MERLEEKIDRDLLNALIPSWVEEKKRPMEATLYVEEVEGNYWRDAGLKGYEKVFSYEVKSNKPFNGSGNLLRSGCVVFGDGGVRRVHYENGHGRDGIKFLEGSDEWERDLFSKIGSLLEGKYCSRV